MAKNDGVMFYDEFTRTAEPVGREKVAARVQGVDLTEVASLSTFTANMDALHQGLVKSGAPLGK